MLIIDCHGHYTTAPDAHQKFRDAAARARSKDPLAPTPAPAQHQRRRDPRDHRKEPAEAAARARRGHHDFLAARLGDGPSHRRRAVSQAWTRACNDLIKRVVDLYPENFVGVCQLPQSPGVPISHSIAELERCVKELGFVGCNLNPDPSGGHWTAPPLTDRHWYPFYEKMVGTRCARP